jgi:hypothetical protein
MAKSFSGILNANFGRVRVCGRVLAQGFTLRVLTFVNFYIRPVSL